MFGASRPGPIVEVGHDLEDGQAHRLSPHGEPCHVNYQLFGNAVPHVHAHVIPRYLDDPAPGRPLPDPVSTAAATLPPQELHGQLADLREAAGRRL